MDDPAAHALHKSAIVADAHSDVFCDVARRRLVGETEVLARLHVPAWRSGGVNLVVTTLFTEEEHKPDRALRRAVTLVGSALADIDETPDVSLCRTRAEIDATIADGQIAFVLAMEGGEPIQDGVASLRMFYELGIRVLGLTWNQRNLLAEGIGEARANGGLTELGREIVAEANRLGILLDASHLSVRSFWDLIEASERPVIASHSNALALCGHPRNLDDDQIRAIAQSGGIIGINAVAQFIDDNRDAASLERMLDHLDHVASIAGVEHIALGPDFVDYMRSGPGEPLSHAPDGIPTGFSTISEFPNVTAGLLARGYDENTIRGVLGGNLLRLLDSVMAG
ncbi:MAG: dipeptidase [Thermomicrobiales bacterium]|nr:dipeptidase [Thermomicrobiales bacterium]